jgi:hypothetical protein
VPRFVSLLRAALTALLLSLGVWPVAPFAQTPGALVVVGGGSIDPVIITRTIELSGGSRAVVAVLPQASASPTAGDSGVALWLKAGAHEAFKVDIADRAAARAALGRAKVMEAARGALAAGTGLVMHVLRAGMSFDLNAQR